ncbi:hypothetical protein VCSRO96_1583 [Vibrio cholerae]|nr:hypothetical protein [Vibrio cholerae]EGR2080129.1 hypothetical protein [Vibrio cholerae]EGR2514013.1 hypothetical protein [Vibrio cholerae]EGR4056678.1 hypothetical protein [Vibrio cholerae]EGR4416079.1 hypothetical protein [Vibrio cholerae]
MSDYLAFLAKIHIFVKKEFETFLGVYRFVRRITFLLDVAVVVAGARRNLFPTNLSMTCRLPIVPSRWDITSYQMIISD